MFRLHFLLCAYVLKKCASLQGQRQILRVTFYVTLKSEKLVSFKKSILIPF